MRKIDVLSELPYHWQLWANKHLTIEEASRKKVAKVSIKNGKLYMRINPIVWENISKQDKINLFLHEVAHIIRGDLFVKAENHKAANMAQDAVINDMLGITKIGSIPGCTRESLGSLLGEKLPEKCGWEYIYNKLMKLDWNDDGDPDDDDNDMQDVVPSDPTEENMKKLKEAIIDAVPIFKELFTTLKEKEIRSRKIKTSILSTYISKVKRIVNNAMEKGKKRSYRRNRQVGEGILKKTHTDIVNRIFLLFDVSGSCEGLIPIFEAIEKYMASEKKIFYEVGVFSTEFEVCKSVRQRTIPTECTYIEKALKYVDQKDYNLCIVFTDGEIFDLSYKILPENCQMLWVLTGNKNVPMRKKDFSISFDKVLA
jgi:predicted metal-dependent peptidase